MIRRRLGIASVALGRSCAEPSATDRPPSAEAAASVAPSVVRRLGRREYDNTMRDLLGTSLRPGARFPADDHAHGFDNIAEAMNVSSTQLELYELATDQIVDQLLHDPSRWHQVVPCAAEPTPPRECARATIEDLGPRAWRRPLAPEERDELLALYDAARAEPEPEPELEPSEQALAQVLRAMLLSPYFLFRVERDPPGPGPHPVTPHELATRLSYFLWSSMPDDELRAAADEGRLSRDAELRAQVTRMLEDPRAEALVDDLGGQWLYIRALDDVFRDASRFPRFDEELREDMKQELRWMFRSFIEEDRDIRELLVSPRTFASSRLSRHYGLAAVAYEGVRELDLSALPRAGWLTTPGLMTALSPPFRTSPPQRGRWVLSQLLCQPLSPPPAGVTVLRDSERALTLREQLEAHRSDPACAGCHAAMDPIGLAFEHYDAVGSFRRYDGDASIDAPIDASGQLPSGERFEDATQLSQLIAADPAFIDCTVRQVFTYAMGRAPTDADAPHLETITQRFAAADHRFVELLVSIVQSVPFRHRVPSRTPDQEPS